MFIQFGLVVSIVCMILVFEKMDLGNKQHADQNYVEISIEEEAFLGKAPLQKTRPTPIKIQEINIIENDEEYDKLMSKSTKQIIDYPVIDFEYIEEDEETEEYIHYVNRESKKPEFIGGKVALQSYISKNIVYPQSAIDSSIQGKVYVRFIVDKVGRITKPEIIRKIHPLLDKEAMRVISEMPNWQPGKVNGIIKGIPFTVPVTFIISI